MKKNGGYYTKSAGFYKLLMVFEKKNIGRDSTTNYCIVHKKYV